MEERKVFTLLQLGNAIKRRIDAATDGASFWIRAEIATITVKQPLTWGLCSTGMGRRWR
ncbi:MAG: hypothetical protein IPI41_03065 [Flavobacteriales bacterium]|nr:hypothetical protein [Flavobacteriales bacterium]